MCSHPSVEFRALQTKTTLKITVSRLWPYPSIPNHFDLITVARVLFTNQPQFKQQLAPWSGSDLQPSTKLSFTQDQQHGQGKTQHCVHNKKGSAELGRVVVDTQHSSYSDTRYGGEQLFLLRSTRSSDANSVSECPLRNDSTPVYNVQICCFTAA